MTPAEMSAAITDSIMHKYTNMPRKWPVTETKPRTRDYGTKKVAKPSKGTMGYRLMMRREALGISRRKMREDLGLKDGSLYAWEMGTKKVSAKSMERIVAYLGVTEQWLKEGKR